MNGETRKLNPNLYFGLSITVFAILACFQFTLGCEQIKPKREMTSTNSAVSGEKQRLLEGTADSPARAALYNYTQGESVDLSTVSVVNGRMIHRTGLQIWFVPGATVGEINSLLQSIDGSIIGMMSGVDMLYVRISDTGDVKSVFSTKSRIESEAVVRYVVIDELSPYPDDVVFDLSKLTREETIEYRRVHCALGDCDLGLSPRGDSTN